MYIHVDFLIFLIPTPLVSALFNHFFFNVFHLLLMFFICFIREAHTNERFISCDGHQLYAFKGWSVNLEVEGVRYIEMYHGPHSVRPASFKGWNLKLEGGVNVSLQKHGIV